MNKEVKETYVTWALFLSIVISVAVLIFVFLDVTVDIQIAGSVTEIKLPFGL